MWTKSKEYDVKDLPALSAKPLLVSPSFIKQKESALSHKSEEMLDEEEFNFIASLSYTVIPDLTDVEKLAVLRWVLARWSFTVSTEVLEQVPLTQVEYFFFGTDNGHLFVTPLVPTSALRFIAMREYCDEESRIFCSDVMKGNRNNNCGPRRLLHQHAREEPVVGLHVLGSLVASSSSDGSVAVSLFHPQQYPVVLIPHPHPLRTVKLWEGAPFSSVRHEDRGEDAAVYVITGDENSALRMWRVDVVKQVYILEHVFVMTPSFLRMHSPLDYAKAEDYRKGSIDRETGLTVHCLGLDGNHRILAGVEGGVYCWCIEKLPWKDCYDTLQHPLRWDEEERDHFPSSTASPVRVRAERLVNHHVWVRDNSFVSSAIERYDHACKGVFPPTRSPTRWKPKHQSTVAGGASVGVIANEVEIHLGSGENEATESLLNRSLITVSFEEGELRKDIVVPVSCVEPVVYPLTHLKLPTTACYALEILEANSRLITSHSNGCIGIWTWKPELEDYEPLIMAGQTNMPRGLGKQLCVMRSPDIFLSSGYDDALVKEWHLYDEPQYVLRCERRFTLLQTSQLTHDGVRRCEDHENVSGVSAMFAVPLFGALFVVGVFEQTIQTFRIAETQGCEVPSNFLYNGFQTVKLDHRLSDEEYPVMEDQ